VVDVDADVIVVGAGPTGLMLAGELARWGVQTLLLERRPVPSDRARAGGLAGQVVQLLHYRGEIERLRAGRDTDRELPPRFPFGGLQLDFTRLEHPPMQPMLMSQRRLEELLAERADEQGAGVRRGHEVLDLQQDDDSVVLTVQGPDGPYSATARFVVGCDGGGSRVRDLIGTPFEGTTLPEVERLAAVTVPDSVRVLEDGSLDVADVGRIPFGYTATARGVFACSGTGGRMSIYTAEVESTGYADDAPMTVAELDESVRRVLGVGVPLGEPLSMTRFGYSAKQADHYRAGRVFLAGDAAHLFPSGGVSVNVGMLDAANLAWKLAAGVQGWAPTGLLDTYDEERRAAADRVLLHTQAQVALRRGHGPTGDALRALMSELLLDEQPLRRLGALLAGADVGAGEATSPVVGAFLTDLVLGVDHEDPRFAGFLGTGRPTLLDLADRADLRDIAARWADRLDVVGVAFDERPVDAVLVLPDARIAWTAAVDEPADTAGPAFGDAVTDWLGAPRTWP